MVYIVLKNQGRICKQWTYVPQAWINIFKGKKRRYLKVKLVSRNTLCSFYFKTYREFFFSNLVQFLKINISVYDYMVCTLAFFSFQLRSQNFKQGNSPLWLYLRVDHHHIVFRKLQRAMQCVGQFDAHEWNVYLRQDNWNVIGGSELGAFATTGR